MDNALIFGILGDVSGRGLPNLKPFLEGFEDRFFAGYQTGMGYSRAFGQDVSGNGRTANVTGVPDANRSAHHVTLGTGSKIIFPFSGAELAGPTAAQRAAYTDAQWVALTAAQKAAINGKATIIAIAKTAPSGAAYLAGNFVSAATSYFALSVDVTNNGRAWVRNDATAGVIHQATIDNATPDAGRATRYEMSVLTIDGAAIKATRLRSGAAPQVTAFATIKLAGGDDLMQAGASLSAAGYPGPFDVAEYLFFTGALTLAELQSIFATEVPRLASAGIGL